MSVSKVSRETIINKLGFLYGRDRAQNIYKKINELIDRYQKNSVSKIPKTDFLNEKDIVLITYGDNIQVANKNPLQSLFKFADEYLEQAINIIHILPFYPYSSDDGFSVIDYKKVNPALGDWKDIEDISQKFNLMFDLVANHISSESIWFKEYLKGNPKYNDY
ncbi:sugar phosphorylase, partial [bacterium]|nr:sugar phosphorylase [bacterium]